MQVLYTKYFFPDDLKIKVK